MRITISIRKNSAPLVQYAFNAEDEHQIERGMSYARSIAERNFPEFPFESLALTLDRKPLTH